MPAFERILVPVDLFPASEEAIADGSAIPAADQHVEVSAATRRSLELAAELARSSGGTLRILHATPPLHVGTLYTGPVGVPAQVVDEIHARAKKATIVALTELRHRICPDVAAKVVACPGHPLTVVLADAESWKPSLIVLAASGRSRVVRFFVGSTADRVIREALCPVLVVPAH
jgi:nucleotide-binding universal stress UspA family protein